VLFDDTPVRSCRVRLHDSQRMRPLEGGLCMAE
jgi:hypothetical protein